VGQAAAATGEKCQLVLDHLQQALQIKVLAVALPMFDLIRLVEGGQDLLAEMTVAEVVALEVMAYLPP
jgi:hypothetical protein